MATTEIYMHNKIESRYVSLTDEINNLNIDDDSKPKKKKNKI